MERAQISHWDSSQAASPGQTDGAFASCFARHDGRFLPSGRITTIARQLAYFGYLALDVLVWSNNVKFTRFTPETAQKIQKFSNRFWVIGIFFSLLNGVAKNVRLHKELLQLKSSATEKDLGSENERKVKAASLKAARAATLHQFTIDALDIWIPATGLGLTNINDGVLGIFGLITSLLAAQKHWQSVTGKK
ncbi:peroxisomal biogenesis factor 11-domain-containing protein [Mucidula mucida]|nr:peroxisomal biogenesis factor 11-domain-containing protein [Mucidula mucida]